MVTRNPTWVEQDYRFINDDGSQAAATAIAAINTAISRQRNVIFRCRINFGDTNNANANNVRSVKLQFRVNGGTWTDVGSSSLVQFATSAHVTDGNNDPNERLNSIPGSSFQSAWEEFDSNNTTTSRTWGDTYTEYEWCIRLSTSLTVGDTVELRVVTSSAEVPTITNTPTITVASDITLKSDSDTLAVALSEATATMAGLTNSDTPTLTATESENIQLPPSIVPPFVGGLL